MKVDHKRKEMNYEFGNMVLAFLKKDIFFIGGYGKLDWNKRTMSIYKGRKWW